VYHSAPTKSPTPPFPTWPLYARVVSNLDLLAVDLKAASATMKREQNSRYDQHNGITLMGLIPGWIRFFQSPNAYITSSNAVGEHSNREDGVFGRSYSDPQEGLSVLSFLLLLANSEISVRAATAETPTDTTMNSKMISIFWFCLRF
jgi:hypothetical protein